MTTRHLQSDKQTAAASRARALAAQNAMHRYAQFVALAEAKIAAGDRVEAENYYQHAEHFFRSAALQKQEHRQ